MFRDALLRFTLHLEPLALLLLVALIGDALLLGFAPRFEPLPLPFRVAPLGDARLWCIALGLEPLAWLLALTFGALLPFALRRTLLAFGMLVVVAILRRHGGRRQGASQRQYDASRRIQRRYYICRARRLAGLYDAGRRFRDGMGLQ